MNLETMAADVGPAILIRCAATPSGQSPGRRVDTLPRALRIVPFLNVAF